MSDDDRAAVRRVRSFVKARATFHGRKLRRPGDRFLTPEHLTAEYGQLDMNDLLALCDAAERND